MTTYNSYEAAKIANPDKEILTDHKKVEFTAELGLNYYHKCNPADHCMTVEKFLADGRKFVEGDCYLNSNGVSIGLVNIPWVNNNPSDLDSKLFILRAAALENQMNIDNLVTQTPEEKEPELTKDDSPQGVISAISNRLHNIGCEHQDSELGEELGSMACDIWGVLPLISNESIQEKKPRTKFEYVKCEYGDKASNIVMDFENNAPLYKVVNDEYWTIDELDDLFAIILDGGEHIYRRIETPMTEREAFIDGLSDWAEDSGLNVSAEVWDSLFDSGLVKLVN